jgi:8-amino-7-oxononanoate synthase
MLDFTSSLYLGMTHSSGEVGGWASMTTGRPAALGSLPLAADVAGQVAALQGLAAGLVARSTLHGFVDVLATLARGGPIVVAVDRDAYPVAGWAVRSVGCEQAVIVTYAHLDPADLRARLRQAPPGMVVVVSDGYCPVCCRVAPLGAYLAFGKNRPTVVVVDDTQSFGLLGRRDPSDRTSEGAAAAWGRGGGGTLPWSSIGARSRGDVLTVTSLAKSFGAPLAVIAGPAHLIADVAAGPTQIHTSPPTEPDLLAARNALGTNRLCGGRLRDLLWDRIQRFRSALAATGLLPAASVPVQPIGPFPPAVALDLHHRLSRYGVRTVVQRRHDDPRSASVVFALTLEHTPDHIDTAARLLTQALAARGARRTA